jgi:hypothetical protein
MKYVLIDFENIQPEDVSPLDQQNLRIRVFYNSRQKKKQSEFAKRLKAIHVQAEFVEMVGGGADALDILIGFTIGQISVRDPAAKFYVISRDDGFQSTLEHLRNGGTTAYRFDSLEGLKAPKPASPTVARADAAGAFLAVPENKNKPRSAAKLRTWLKSHLREELTEAQEDAVIKELGKRKVLKLNGTKVEYLGTDTV